MDLDDLDDPTRQPPQPKPPKFAPKSKFQPKPKPKPEPRHEPPAAPTPVSVKKEDESHSLSDAVIELKEEEVKSPKDGDAMEVDGGGVEVEVAVEVEEEVDVVVDEYDVYFNPSSGDTQLYVLQYALRPKWRPYDLDQNCKQVRLKPKTGEVEVDLEVDKDSGYHDPDAATAQKMEKLTLSSSPSPPHAAGYAVGVFSGKKLFLNPIHAIVQLRPSMGYFDSGNLKKRNVPDIAVKAEGSNTVARVGSSNKQGKPMVPEEAESWVPLTYHSSTSDLSEKHLRNMMKEENKQLEFPMKPYDYLNSLCPASAINKSKLRGPSRRSLLSLPLEDRLKMWFIEKNPIQRFSALKHLAPDDPDEHVFCALQSCARLVQGLWVVKTTIKHRDAPGFEKLVRDYALLLFSRGTEIKDSDFDILGSQKPSAKVVLREIAVERQTCNDWKFKESTDVLFLKRYPDIVEQERILWEDVQRRLHETFDARNRKLGAKFQSAMRIGNIEKPGSSIHSDEVPSKATNAAPSVRMSMSKETREALPKVLRKLFQSHKVCSFNTICQGLRDLAVSMSTLPKADARAAVAAALSVDGPPEELQAVIGEVAVPVHGVYVLKSSSEHPEFNPLRNVVIELFLGAGPNAKLKKSAIIEAAKIKLQKEPTNTEFQKVITEFCVSKGGAWVLKNGDGAPQ